MMGLIYIINIISSIYKTWGRINEFKPRRWTANKAVPIEPRLKSRNTGTNHVKAAAQIL